MCGLTGFLGGLPESQPELMACVTRMSDRIAHRGPDGEGHWVDAQAGIALGHRRLSIVDLSEAGAQPMMSASGRFVIAFNGEIYNHLALRQALQEQHQSVGWRGHSDTESLLAGFEAWGVESTISRAVGMFAMAIWDRRSHELILVRDRLGEKPLYYGWQGTGARRTFLFGSELKALQSHPAFSATIDRAALGLFVRHNYIGAPWSIFAGIRKLPPGCFLRVSQSRPEVEPIAYWRVADATTGLREQPFVGTEDQAADELERLLKIAIARQMVADVPLGAFLSGGVDSSTVVALMQAQSTRPVRTFTIGSEIPAQDEAVHAKAVATHLHTDHTELMVTAVDAMKIIPELPGIYCEPFADSSQIPTYLVSRLARRHVTVALSGDGADELLGGYNRYQVTRAAWRRLQCAPRWLRQTAAAGLRALPPATWDRMTPVLPGARRFNAVGDKIHKGARVLGSASSDELYRGLVSHVDDPSAWLIDGREHSSALTSPPPEFAKLNSVERMMALDALTYLPDDIMAKVDRASMAVSLETRAPFLDHQLFEFAWRLPLAYKLNQGQTKWLLRQVLYRHVPRELIERPKSGFGIPLGAWLRGPLRPWAETLLSESNLKLGGFFRVEAVRHIWLQHLKESFNHAPILWNVLMFEAWLANNRKTA